MGVPSGMWTNFCNTNDGGKGNAQLQNKDLPFNGNNHNQQLVKLGRNVRSKVDKQGTTTSMYEATYTRAVMKFAFAKLPQDKDYGLRVNPCWPKPIVPNDPGFVLQRDDGWYAAQPNEVKALTASYNREPSPQLLADATKNNPAKRPLPNENADPNADLGPVQKRSFELVNDNDDMPILAIRDVNVTRRMTDEELANDVQVVDCQDHECSNERRALEDNNEEFLVVRGNPLADAPVENVLVARTVVVDEPVKTLITKVRRAVNMELPVATGKVG